MFREGGVTIRIRDLVKIYKRGRLEVQALRGVSTVFPSGVATVVMGPSGSGKTTLLNIIGGVDRPTGGSVDFGGVKLEALSERQLDEHRLRNVGYVFQAINLIPSLTALENVELPMVLAGVPQAKRRRRALALLEALGVKERADHYPDELSGGEQQRVAIAVALANDPPVILADEPTAELDYDTAKNVVELLVGLARKYGKTVIMTTHDPRVAVRADRILRLEDGRLVGEYKPVELTPDAIPAGKPTPGGYGLVELVRTRLAAVEMEMEELEAKLRSGELSLREAFKRYEKLEREREALQELLARIGG